MTAPKKVTAWKVTLDQYRATWNWTVHFPEGGSFGSNYCRSKKIALHKALIGVPAGTEVLVVTKHRGKQISAEIIRR